MDAAAASEYSTLRKLRYFRGLSYTVNVVFKFSYYVDIYKTMTIKQINTGVKNNKVKYSSHS